MKDGWKWLVIGLLLGALATWFGAREALTKEQKDWLARREVVLAQLEEDAGTLAAARAARLAADSARRADSVRAATAEAHDRVMGDSVVQAKRQLAAARNAQDSIAALQRIVARQDTQLVDKDERITRKDAMLAAGRLRAQEDSIDLAKAQRQIQDLRDLVKEAPVGKTPPKLLGFLPRPRFVVGGGVIGDKQHVGLGFFAGPAFAL